MERGNVAVQRAGEGKTPAPISTQNTRRSADRFALFFFGDCGEGNIAQRLGRVNALSGYRTQKHYRADRD
jgi:hypothetical protein